MINHKILYNDLENIVALGLFIESFYKGQDLNESYDRSVRLDPKSIHGCNTYFSQASHNWCKSKLNLNINRCS